MRLPPKLLPLVALLSVAPSAVASSPPARPDILILLADDMGFADLGCYGSEVPTPNIDRLAARGVRFTDFHTCARCSPSRAALLTGRYPQAVGMGHLDTDMGKPGYRGRLDPDAPTLAERLRDAGYDTALAGKWHLGLGEGHRPWDRGFRRSRGLLGGAADYFKPMPARPFGEDGKLLAPEDLPADFYMTDDIAATASRYIATAPADKPLFLYVAFTAPHYPLQAHEADIAPRLADYAKGPAAVRDARFARMKASGLLAADATLAPYRFPEWAKLPPAARASSVRDMATYAAQIVAMDRGVGKILDALEKSGRAGNTLVMFLSDNGATREQHDRGYGPHWATVSNTPFRSFKAHTYRGGTADPLLVVIPGGAPGGARIERSPTHIIDLAPTCLEFAGLAPSPSTDGVSLSARLSDAKAPAAARTLFWEHEGRRGALDSGRKLVSEPGRAWELYDARDTGETRDLAAAEPDAVKRLAGEWREWAAGHRVDPRAAVRR